MILRLGRQPETVDAAARRRYREQMLAAVTGESRPHYERYASRMDFPDAMPFFQAIEVGGDGNLWVQRYEPAWAEGDQLWDVFDTGGSRVATVVMSSEIANRCGSVFRLLCDGILEIGHDLLMRLRDSSTGVNRVAKYRLLKEPR